MRKTASGDYLSNNSNSELNLMRLGHSGEEIMNMKPSEIPQKRCLQKEIEQRTRQRKHISCEILIDDHVIDCHLFLLRIYSQLFVTNLKPYGKFKINSDYCSVDTFKKIYDWMLEPENLGKLLTPSIALDIYRASDYLQIEDLKELGFAFMSNEKIFNEEIAFLLYLQAKEKKCNRIVSLMLPRIRTFFFVLVSSAEWVKLDIEGVKDILTSNYIQINSEMEVFASAVRWLKHDWNGRWSWKDELFACVRFGHIDDWQLVDIKRNSTNPDYLLLGSDPAINKMINEGIAFASIEKHYKDEAIKLSLCQDLNVFVPAPRNWTGVKQIHFTFESFLLFVEAYREEYLLERRMSRGDKKYLKFANKESRQR